jgi:hypothetical protein
LDSKILVLTLEITDSKMYLTAAEAAEDILTRTGEYNPIARVLEAHWVKGPE